MTTGLSSFPYGALFVGISCIAFGLGLIIMTYFFPGVLEVEVPTSVVLIWGLLFAVAGLALLNGHVFGPGVDKSGHLLPGASPAVIVTQNILGTSMLALFTLGFLWFAFGQGEIHSSGVTSTAGVMTRTSDAGFYGRLMARGAMLILFLFFLSSLYYTVKDIIVRLSS